MRRTTQVESKRETSATGGQSTPVSTSVAEPSPRSSQGHGEAIRSALPARSCWTCREPSSAWTPARRRCSGCVHATRCPRIRWPCFNGPLSISTATLRPSSPNLLCRTMSYALPFSTETNETSAVPWWTTDVPPFSFDFDQQRASLGLLRREQAAGTRIIPGHDGAVFRQWL